MCFLAAYLSPLQGDSVVRGYPPSPALQLGLGHGLRARRSPAGAAQLPRSCPWCRDLDRLPALRRARWLAGGRLHRRAGLDAAATLRAGLRAPRPARLRAHGTLRPTHHARTARAVRTARRFPASRHARFADRLRSHARRPPSVCSGSAIRSTSSGVPQRSPRHSPLQSKRSTSPWRTGPQRSASRLGSRRTPPTRTLSSELRWRLKSDSV